MATIIPFPAGRARLPLRDPAETGHPTEVAIRGMLLALAHGQAEDPALGNVVSLETRRAAATGAPAEGNASAPTPPAARREAAGETIAVAEAREPARAVGGDHATAPALVCPGMRRSAEIIDLTARRLLRRSTP
jgi:hypothetical protein